MHCGAYTHLSHVQLLAAASWLLHIHTTSDWPKLMWIPESACAFVSSSCRSASRLTEYMHAGLRGKLGLMWWCSRPGYRHESLLHSLQPQRSDRREGLIMCNEAHCTYVDRPSPFAGLVYSSRKASGCVLPFTTASRQSKVAVATKRVLILNTSSANPNDLNDAMPRSLEAEKKCPQSAMQEGHNSAANIPKRYINIPTTLSLPRSIRLRFTLI